MTVTALQIIQPQLPIGNLEAYISRINQVPLLTFEEECQLATDFRKKGDLIAAQKLVLSHLRYVVRVARGYLGYGLPLADLIQEGTIGLMKAVRRFDPALGVRLVSFAVHWVKAEIHEYILKNWRIVKVVTTKQQRKLFFKLRKAKKRLGWSTQAEVKAIAKDLNVSPVEVRRMEERLSARDITFDLPASGSGEEIERNALVPAEYLEDCDSNPALQLEEQDWNSSIDEKFDKAFRSLDAKSQNILEKRWLSEKKSTLQELAQVYGVSLERIRQIEKSALETLKTILEKKSLRDVKTFK